MNSSIKWLETIFANTPLPLLEVWGRFGYIIGFILMLSAFGGFTFRIGGQWGFGRQRQEWDVKALLSIPLTFVLIFVTGYIGSSIVIVPGAQTFESLKDLSVFLCILLFGYPALIAVPFAYGLSDLIEGVPPGFLLDWLVGYFINPACFWIAYQFIGKNPDFKRVVTWAWYLLFVLIFMIIEPQLWGYICSGKFTAEISYRHITPALFFTTSITWILAPFAMLIVLPLARKYGMFWAEIPGHIKEKFIGYKEWVWESGQGKLNSGLVLTGQGLPIRMFIAAPFIAFVLIMVGSTAYLTLNNSEKTAAMLASHLHQEISENINLQLDSHLLQTHRSDKKVVNPINELLKSMSIANKGRAFIADQNGRIFASSKEKNNISNSPDESVITRNNDIIMQSAIRKLYGIIGNLGEIKSPVQFHFDVLILNPLSKEMWLAQATPYRNPASKEIWIVVTAMPESYYLEGVRAGNSQTAMLLAIALTISLLFAVFLAGFVAAPIDRISRALNSISQGDLTQRVPGSRLEELGALSNYFNHMTGQLMESFERTRSSEERFRQLAENIQEVFWITNADMDEMIYISPAYESIWGRSQQSLYDEPKSWLDAVHPEDRERLLDTLKFSADKTFDIEYKITRPDKTIRWIRDQGFPVYNKNGIVMRRVGVALDITRQRELEAELLHSQRLESLGTLAGGIAHDFNNILTIIMGYASIIKQNLKNPEKIEKSIDIIQNTADRGASLVKQLLTLARKTETEFKTISVNDIVNDALTIVTETFPKSITVQSNLEGGTTNIQADATQLHQVFLNLFLNARDAMPNGGTLSIASRIVNDELVASIHRKAITKKYVMLEISDTGVGIDEEDKRRIFDPFFTTKDIGKGTGLGLALVYGIIENHKGFITVDSIVGQGTKFTFYIPIEENSDDTITPVKSQIDLTNGIKKEKVILLIEDEEALVEVFLFFLTPLGYKVIIARDGEAGIAAFSKSPAEIDLVISDLGLPKVGGLEVLQEIRKMSPSVDLILASGYIDPELRSEIDKLGIKGIIQKPFHFDSILEMLTRNEL